MFKAMLTALALLFALPASAEETRIGDWTVHYSAFPSTFLSPEVAQGNNIERSRYNGLLNIAVLDADGKPVQVSLSGQGKNLLGNVRRLEFQTIREGEALYYIAQYPYRNEDNVLFTIDIQGARQGGELSFRHTFYTD
ncbi:MULTISPECIES: DUF4426 domain-containing protein [Oceanimonas]|uniref:DUF4426 domain-containing protein n=1 Tax=Oceanimonas doudoroffii TaxID=84158 RepID=A0A233RJQ3_9GAMM|nr:MULTISPECIES: DUF4426 domain-containing protein [Oceanimonas]NHH99790.1 hypothetical protein [Oceanimonas sp. MB9]OXY83615.1 hypothetical protein B6S08_09085 [Oceanimonas doudoroffii]